MGIHTSYRSDNLAERGELVKEQLVYDEEPARFFAQHSTALNAVEDILATKSFFERAHLGLSIDLQYESLKDDITRETRAATRYLSDIQNHVTDLLEYHFTEHVFRKSYDETTKAERFDYLAEHQQPHHAAEREALWMLEQYR